MAPAVNEGSQGQGGGEVAAAEEVEMLETPFS